MNRFFLFCGIVVGLLLNAVATAEPADEQPAQEIPLDQIWGFNLPGTRDIAGIPLPEGNEKVEDDAALRKERERRIEDIRRALAAKQPTERSLPGFVYPRRPDFFTLRAVASQLLSDANGLNREGVIQRSFPRGDELTLIFFSHPASYYVRLRKVEQKGNTFLVHYQLEPHKSAEVTSHFALIPLGKLAAGEYTVDFHRIPEDRKYLEAGFDLVTDSSPIVCDTFSFTVFDPPVESPPAENATLIPLDRIWAFDMPGTQNVRELESKRRPGHPWRVSESPDVARIAEILRESAGDKENAGTAFIVIGEGKEALRNVRHLMDGTAPRQAELPSGVELSLVFYSLSFGRYVHIKSVERLDRTITVKYRFLSHATTEATVHFAIIPVGKLPPDEFRVSMRQLPPKNINGATASYVPNPEKFVSSSFSFRIREPEAVP